jgi:hypothetical protein
MTSGGISSCELRKRLLRLAFGLAIACLTALAACLPAGAHEVRPAYLAIEEVAPGEFDVLFKMPMRGDMRLALSVAFSGGVEALTPVVSRPTGDAMIQSWRLRAVEPLAGQSVLIDGLRTTMTDALLRVGFADGTTFVERLTPGSPQATIPVGQDSLEVAATYVVQGIEHILFGVDHLLFVAALLLIIRDWRVLVKTITAFTIAHSMTLTLATFGLVTLPSGPVEALIALSILLVAAEAVRMRRGETSIAITWPWVVAFAFGLLHGFGFAGALREVGLPPGDIPLALFSFNVGVEIGQLIFVAAILLVVAAARRIITIPRAAFAAPAYVIGIVAAFWVIERVASTFFFDA